MNFDYEETTSPRPAITNVDYAELLKIIIVLITVNVWSLIPSKWAVVGQENNEDNTSKKNKSHERENTQQSL
jgi:hypothetical protein